MSASSPVSAGDDILAAAYNNLREDVLDPVTGHDHEGVEGKVLGAGALGTDSVETLKIKDGNVTTAKIKDLNVTQGKLATPCISTNRIIDEAVTLDKIKLSTGSYSQSVATGNYTAAFSPSYYSHQVRIKSSHANGKQTLYFAQCEGSSYDQEYKIKNEDTVTRTLYAYWYYHSNSEQTIWGIWDKIQKKLVAVLVEEDEGDCKLHPELKEGQMLVKFNNPKKFLDSGDKAKIKDKGMAGYILEDASINESDIEEVREK